MDSTVDISLESLSSILILFHFNPNESRKQLVINFIKNKLKHAGKVLNVKSDQHLLCDGKLIVKVGDQEILYGYITKLLSFSKSAFPMCVSSVMGAFFNAERVDELTFLTSPLFLRVYEEYVKTIKQEEEDGAAGNTDGGQPGNRSDLTDEEKKVLISAALETAKKMRESMETVD